MLGIGPGGEKLEHLLGRLSRKTALPAPRQDAVEWAQEALATLERGQGKTVGDPKIEERTGRQPRRFPPAASSRT